MDKEVELKDEERQPCEVITRVMGYMRPKEFFNRGKKSEFEERKNFTEEQAVKHLKEFGDLPDDEPDPAA